jgi:hypothetical protein
LSLDTKKKAKVILQKADLMNHISCTLGSSKTALLGDDEIFDTIEECFQKYNMTDGERDDIVTFLIRIINKWDESTNNEVDVKFAHLSAQTLAKILHDSHYFDTYVTTTRKAFATLRTLKKQVAYFKFSSNELTRKIGIDLDAAMNRKSVQEESRLILWIDDTENEIMNQVRQAGIHLYHFTTVAAAIEFIDQHKELNDLGPTCFRIIVNQRLSIKIRNKTIVNERAGLDLIEKVKSKLRDVPILVCGDISTGHSKCFSTLERDKTQFFALLGNLADFK